MNKYFHIYGTLDCPYCLEAITILNSLGYEYALTILDQSQTYTALIKTSYAHNTVPIITYCEGLDKEEFVGGADNLVKFLQKTFEKSDPPSLTSEEE